jgi:hypothetical protein
MTTDTVIEIEGDFNGPAVYYGRVVQKPLSWPGMVWSSPIWINEG